MKKTFLLLTMLIAMISTSYALTAGDIAIIAVFSDDPDLITFVPLEDIAANTVITFTDNAWTTANGPFATNEGYVEWTCPSGGITKGTVTSLSAYGNIALAVTGDQVIAFEGTWSNRPTTANSASFIYAFSLESFITSGTTTSNTSFLPSALSAASVTMTTSTTETDNAYFANGTVAATSVTVSGTKSELLALFTDTSKYHKNDTRPTLPTYSITVNTSGGNVPPSISNIVQTPSTDIINTSTVSVSATITDSDGTVVSAQLRWGTTAGTYGTTIGMTASGSTYTTTTSIPAQTTGTTVYYVIDATDDDAATTTSSEQSYSVVAPPPPVAPVATAATGVANTSFTANWNAVSGATGYYLDVYNGTQTELINTGFEGSTSFPTGWTQNSSYVNNSSADAHTGTYYAGMNAANDYFNTPILASPTTISFWTRASSTTANNTTIVQYSSDASTWTDLATYAANGSDSGDVTFAWSQKTINANLTGNYYIRWFMSQRSGGSAYFDDVLIVSGTKTYVLQNQNVTSGTSYNVPGLTAGTTYYYVVRAYNAYGTSGDSNEIEVTTTNTTPTITVSTATLSGFGYMEGSGPSTEQSFTVSGSNLTANISIDAPTNYEISTGTGAGFNANMSDPLVLTQSGGTVGTTTIYVRLKAGLAAGDYNGEVITASSTGADNKTVTCSGTVTPIPDPEITVSATTLSGFSYVVGSGPSAEQSFTVSGTYLTANINLDAPASYEISRTSGISFSAEDPLVLTASKLDVAETTIYVRLKAGLAEGAYNGEEISITSTDAETKTVILNGYVQTSDVPFLYWDFNDGAPSSGNWTQPIDANYGTGSLTYTFANSVSFTGTTLNTMVGDVVNGGSFVPQGGTGNVNNGKEFVMTVNTTDLENITLTYATQRTSTGFTDQAIWYSLDGGQNYTLFTTFTSIASSWEVKEVDFSSITGANDNPNFMVKIVLDGASAPLGNNRFDNISFFGDEEDVNPVELASFTATISAQNYITLTWVTQTETGMRGYYIYRANSNQISTALSVSPLIAATNSSQQQSYAFTDTEVNETGTYFYWLQTNDMDGTVGFHGPVSVFFNALGDNPTPEIPLVTELKSVYPNPFNPTVFIPFSLAKDSNVSFKIYNARGQIVKHFELGSKAAGNYRITWDGTDYNGAALSNGVYQIVMTAGSQVYQTKTTLLK